MKPIRKLSGVDVGSGDTLPTEVLILRRGKNETSKGPIVFDDAAARAVLAAFARGGVDLPIDLEHRSVDPSPAVRGRPDSTDALGWFRLSVRGGNLYMTDIRWTAEGRARLLARKQRYVSPVVVHDADDRAVEILNVALVSMPATYGAQSLIAASKLGRTDSAVVSTRVPVTLRTQLYARAAQAGVSPGEYMRRVLSTEPTDESADALEPDERKFYGALKTDAQRKTYLAARAQRRREAAERAASRDPNNPTRVRNRKAGHKGY